jgi:hypothetical protein
MPRKVPPPEPQSLIAAIVSFEPSYYISRQPGHRYPVSDEALIEIEARIERISAKLKAYLGTTIEITLACAQSFPRDEEIHPRDTPSLLNLNLSKRQCSTMVYLPVGAFWSLARLIELGRLTHIEAIFAPLRYGSGDLRGFYLMPASKAAELLAQAEPDGPWV